MAINFNTQPSSDTSFGLVNCDTCGNSVPESDASAYAVVEPVNGSEAVLAPTGNISYECGTCEAAYFTSKGAA